MYNSISRRNGNEKIYKKKVFSDREWRNQFVFIRGGSRKVA